MEEKLEEAAKRTHVEPDYVILSHETWDSSTDPDGVIMQITNGTRIKLFLDTNENTS